MSGSNIIADTNILIYLTNGNKEIAELLSNVNLYVSEISEIECLSYKGLKVSDLNLLEKMFSETVIVKLNDQIKKDTIKLKRKYSLKLPDAIIAATSRFLNFPLITADKKFRQIDELDLIFFDI